MRKVETVIIGAGPAGLSCAKMLALAGKEVLLLEKKEVIGPKVCCGGLTAKAIALGIPQKVLEIAFKKQILHTPHRTIVIESEEPIVTTVNRKDLGQWMARQAKKAGATIETSTQVTQVNKNSVIANDQEIKFKYLVGADGSSSIVRKFLGLENKEYDVAMQYVVNKQYPDMEWFLDAKFFASGYACIFPHKGSTTIGVCADPRYLKASKLNKNFHKWLKKIKIDVSGAKFESAPINYDYQGYKFGHKFLIGDAAGFTSGLTGEGMYFAMISGQEVASLIIDQKYQPVEIARILDIKKKHEMVLDLCNFSGPLKALEYEILALLLKSKLLDRKFIDIFF